MLLTACKPSDCASNSWPATAALATRSACGSQPVIYYGVTHDASALRLTVDVCMPSNHLVLGSNQLHDSSNPRMAGVKVERGGVTVSKGQAVLSIVDPVVP